MFVDRLTANAAATQRFMARADLLSSVLTGSGSATANTPKMPAV